MLLAHSVSHSNVTTKLFPRGYFLLRNAYVHVYTRGRAKVDGMPEFEIPRTIVNLSNASDTALAQYPPSIEKPNVSHILALFTRRNCSANFYQYLERCVEKQKGRPLVFIVLRGELLISAKRPSGLLRRCESFYFEGETRVMGWKETNTIMRHC